MQGVLRDIAIGILLPGDKLLSVRDYAKQAKINPNTVQRTYMELERIGMVQTQRGQGTFIADDPNMAKKVRSQMTGSTVESFIKEMKRLRYSNSDILELVSKQLIMDVSTIQKEAAEENSDEGVQ